MSIIKFSSQMLKDKCGFVDFQFKYNDDYENDIHTCRYCGQTDNKRNFLLQGVFITDQIDCDKSFIKKFNKSKDYFFHNGNKIYRKWVSDKIYKCFNPNNPDEELDITDEEFSKIVTCIPICTTCFEEFNFEDQNIQNKIIIIMDKYFYYDCFHYNN
jgi:hypothetical protein